MNDHELEGLYPFLHGVPAAAASLDAALLASIADKARESREASAHFFADNGPALLGAAHALADVFRCGGRLFCMGNGGSSCDAAHVTVEFLHPITAGRPALPTVNLTADVAMLSAVGNDVGFEHVFARQLVALGREGDGVLGISTSGNAANVAAGFVKARELGMTTLALVGGDGGRMRGSRALHHCLTVATTSVHRVQECHVVAYHILWDLVHTLLAGERGSARQTPEAR
jgi:D-sedoheptulose 7-phosphate isomerase